MKLPAVAITAAFACGVALGLCPPMARMATSHFWLVAGFAAAVCFVGVGILLLNRARLGAAASVSGVSWILLGVLGAWISAQPLPRSHVVNLIEHGQIDLRTPLRWRGTLRDSSFQLTFLAIGCIAGLAAPWLERKSGGVEDWASWRQELDDSGLFGGGETATGSYLRR